MSEVKMSAQQRMDERDRQRKEQQKEKKQNHQPEKASSEKKRKPAALSSPKAKKVKKDKTKAPKMPKKDPNEPKRPLSSFMMFSQKHREAVKAANPESSFGSLGKLLGDRWKKVSAEEKSAIELVCAENKATYAIQHKTYMESDARQQWEAAMIEQFGEIPGTATNKKGSGKGGGKSTKKKTKDKGPKRACTAYAYFTGAKRAGIKTANPDASFGDIARLVSAAWKECSDEDKQEFVALADADKVRATKDKQEWDAAHPAGEAASSSSQNSPQKKTKDKGPKRACTAYAYFTGAKRAGIKTANPDASFGDIARLVGTAWKECSDEDKQEFVALADADKVRATKDKQEWDALHPDDQNEKKKEKKKVPRPKKATKKKVEEPEEEEEEEEEEKEKTITTFKLQGCDGKYLAFNLKTLFGIPGELLTVVSEEKAAVFKGYGSNKNLALLNVVEINADSSSGRSINYDKNHMLNVNEEGVMIQNNKKNRLELVKAKGFSKDPKWLIRMTSNGKLLKVNVPKVEKKTTEKEAGAGAAGAAAAATSSSSSSSSSSKSLKKKKMKTFGRKDKPGATEKFEKIDWIMVEDLLDTK
jgi:hypothetical protein